MKPCCLPLVDSGQRNFVSCLAAVDHTTNERWLFDATPDFKEQILLLNKAFPSTAATSTTPDTIDSSALASEKSVGGRRDNVRLDGIFLTHAHIGHYTGLIFLGREAMGAVKVRLD